VNRTIDLIPLTVETTGVIVKSNLDEFRSMVRFTLDAITMDLETPEDFGQAEQDIKVLKDAEKRVRDAATSALDEQIQRLIEELNNVANDIRAPRLKLEKLVEDKRAELKKQIIKEAVSRLDIAPVFRGEQMRGIEMAIKGKRTLDSMREAATVYVTEKQASINESRKVILEHRGTFGNWIAPDAEQLEILSPELVAAELRRRKDVNEAEKSKQAELAKLKDSMESVAAKIPSETVAEEWQRFRRLVLDTFKTLKDARDELKHQRNISRAQGFAAAVNHAFKQWD
jgi:hypothetical protein